MFDRASPPYDWQVWGLCFGLMIQFISWQTGTKAPIQLTSSICVSVMIKYKQQILYQQLNFYKNNYRHLLWFLDSPWLMIHVFHFPQQDEANRRKYNDSNLYPFPLYLNSLIKIKQLNEKLAHSLSFSQRLVVIQQEKATAQYFRFDFNKLNIIINNLIYRGTIIYLFISLSKNTSNIQLIIIFNSSQKQQIAHTLQMTESQLKREAFRKQIRQRQINEMFQNARKQYNERQKNGFANFDEKLKKQGIEIVKQFINRAFVNYHSKDYNTMISDAGYMGKQISLRPALISACLNEFLRQNGSKFIDFTKKDISKSKIEKINMELYLQSLEIARTRIQQQVPSELPIIVVNQLMKLSKQIQYQNFSLESAIIMLKFIWNAVEDNFHLPKEQSSKINQLSLQILNNVCISFITLLKGPHHSTIKKHLNQLGLSLKLNQIIIVSINFDTSIHYNLLSLIHLYNSHDSLEPLKQNLNGITIISTENTYKEKYTVYCIYFINKNIQPLLELSLLTLNEIFEEQTYFIDSIKTEFYHSVLELTRSKNRKINFAALELIGTIAFYSQSSSDELVQKNQVLQYIYARLILQRDSPSDSYTTKSIQKCTNILCDLTLTHNKTIKKIIFKHHIWDLIFESLQQGCKLFPVVIVFKYFFFTVQRNQRNKFLPGFLQAVSRLPLDNDMIPEIRQLKETIIQIFYFSMEYVDDQIHDQLIRMYQQNNLLKYIDVHELQPKEK